MEKSESDMERVQKIEHLTEPAQLRVAGGGKTSEKDKEENYDDEPDETIMERLVGLTEMFPEPVRNFADYMMVTTIKSVKGLYKFTCNASWIFFTSSVILFAPIVFETERAQMDEVQKTQQKQVLLGPGSAMSAVGGTPEIPLIR